MERYATQPDQSIDDWDDQYSAIDPDTEPSLRHTVPAFSNPWNKARCEICRGPFTLPDAESSERHCLFCRRASPLSTSSHFNPRSSHQRRSEFISPISRSITLSLEESPNRPSDDQTVDSFTVTFLQRTTGGRNESPQSENIIPVVRFNDETEENASLATNTRDLASSRSDEFRRHITRIVRLARIVNRLFQVFENSNSTGEEGELDWDSRMDEGYSINSSASITEFALIIFALGNSSLTDNSDLNRIINELALERSTHRPPASTVALNKLKSICYGDSCSEKVADDCPICQAEYKPGDELVKLPCSHDYHKDCVLQWLKERDSCPICRRSIESN